MIHISPKAPHYKILQLPLSSFSNCLPFKKKKVKKQISLTSNPDTSPHSEVRYAKTAPVTKQSTSKNMSRGSSIIKYLNNTASKVFKRTYSENSPTASFSYNNMSEIQEYLSKSLEYLHEKISSLESGIHDTIGNILPDNITSETLNKILDDYLHNNYANNETHSVSSSEAEATHLENKIFLNTAHNKKAKTFLKNFEKTNELTVDTSIIGEFITLFTACEKINQINSALLIKQAFPDAHHEQDIANIITSDKRTYNTFMDLNISYFEKPKNRIKKQDNKEEITNKIADFLANNPDSAIRFYKETHAIETALYTIESLQKELFPETHIYLKDDNTTDDIVPTVQETEQNFSKTRMYKEEGENDKIDSIVSVIHDIPDYTKILRITAHNHYMNEFLNIEKEEFSMEDQDIADDLLYFKKNAQKNYKEYLQLLPINEEFYKAIQEFETSGEYPAILSFSDDSASDASSDTASFRGSLSFRNLSLHNLQDTPEQHTIPENITPSDPKIQSHLAKIRDYKKEIFPQDDTPEHIVHTILNNESMKDILLSLYYKQDNANMSLADKDIVTDVIHNPEKHSGINLEFHALLSFKQQLESLAPKTLGGIAFFKPKKTKRLKNIQKHIMDSESKLSRKNMDIYPHLLIASEDINMSSDSFNDILKSPEKLSVYIKDKYTVESNFPVLPITTQHEILSPEPIKEEASASSQPTKTLSHSQTFPVSHHKKTLTLSQSFPEITSITEIEEETSSAKDDTHEFKPQDMFHRVWGKNLKAIEDKVQKTQTSPLQKLQSFKNLQSFTCGLLKPQTQESESSSDMEDFSLNVSEHTYDTHDTSNKRSFSANTEEIEKFKKLKNIYDAIHNTPEFQEDYKKRQEARDAVALKERKDPNPLYYNQIIAQNAQNKKLLTRPKDNIIFQPQMTLETHHEDEENDDGFSLEALTSMLQTKRTPTESNSNIAQEYSFPVSENDELVIYTYEDRSFIKIDSNAAFRNIENIVKNNVFNHRTMKDIFDNIMKSEDFIQTIKHSPATLFKDTPIVSDIALKDTLVNYIAQNTSLTHHVIREINSFLSDEKNMEHFLIAFSVPVARMNQDITIPYLKIPHKNKTATGIKHTGDNTQGHVILEALQAVEENITQEKGKEKVES